MDTLKFKQFYRRNLPHIQPLGATFFVTFRLEGSIPKVVVDRIASERNRLAVILSQKAGLQPTEGKMEILRTIFVMTENCLDAAKSGPTWLKRDDIAEVVKEALHYRDGKVYELEAYCIMSNHVHVVFRPLVSPDTKPGHTAQADNLCHSRSLSRILHSLKGNTASKANRLLKRTGTFWEHESYDHYIRDEREWARIVRYVLNNPVKAGLVREWTQWRWSYFRFGRVA